MQDAPTEDAPTEGLSGRLARGGGGGEDEGTDSETYCVYGLFWYNYSNQPESQLFHKKHLK